jgi:hypothetical protein
VACFGVVSWEDRSGRRGVPLHSSYRQAMTLETNDPRSPPTILQRRLSANRTRTETHPALRIPCILVRASGYASVGRHRQSRTPYRLAEGKSTCIPVDYTRRSNRQPSTPHYTSVTYLGIIISNGRFAFFRNTSTIGSSSYAPIPGHPCNNTTAVAPFTPLSYPKK